MLNCTRIITALSAQQPKGFNMLNGVDKIEGLTEDQQKQINALAQGLTEKNTELLGKINTGKDLSNASAAELEALKLFKQGADIKLAEEGKSYQDAKQLLIDNHNAELEKLKGTNSSNEALITKLLIDDGLNKALDGVKINPALKAGAEAMLRATAKITDGKAMIGDESLSEGVTKWAQSDAGKAFCLAPDNSGGDGNGGGGGSQEKSFKEMNLTERTLLANSDPAKYEQLSKG